ncbi:uncharacterized protein LOC142590491 [Dermacentor variabilis]|uniref:uncharacterized protein LOC142590491 n=1 Tax=Dermacentor variabilis TaxID=34621 RepID=UPI003F5B2EC9
MLLRPGRGRIARRERPLPELLCLVSALLVAAASPALWDLQDIVDDTEGEAWWTPVRREALAAGVCPAGQDLCARGAPDNVCRCDADCARYGDCCVDRSSGDSSEPAPVVSGSRWRCVLENGREFYALASCPDDPAVDSDLRDHCLGRGKQLKPLQHVPVYSNASRTMYANVFCAACHGDLQALRPWQLELHCNRAWNAEKVLNFLAAGHYGKMSHALHGPEGLSCRLQVADASSESFWHELPGLRGCRLASSTCRKSASRRDVVLCSSYTAYVYSPRKFSNYRNFHCFRCAGGSSAGTVECGARPASYAHDAPDVSHLVLGVRSHFINPRKCGHTGTRIYDPLSDACYLPPPSEVLAGDEPSGAPPVEPPAASAFRLLLTVVAAGLTALL